MDAAANCLNCGAALNARQRHCSDCGQAAATRRISLMQFMTALGEVLIGADRNVFALTAALARHPGVVVREYLAGRRKHYFNPFGYLLLVAAASTLVLQWTAPKAPVAAAASAASASAPEAPSIAVDERSGDAATTATTTADSSLSNAAVPAAAETRATPATPPAHSAMDVPPPPRADPSMKTRTPPSEAQQRRGREVGEFMRKQQNLVMLLAVPFNAALFWLAFARRRLHYAEHLVANTYLVAFLMLFTTLLFYPLLAWARGSSAHGLVLAAMLLAHALYCAWAYCGWLRLDRWPQRLYALGVSVTTTVAWATLTTLTLRWYIRG